MRSVTRSTFVSTMHSLAYKVALPTASVSTRPTRPMTKRSQACNSDDFSWLLTLYPRDDF